MKSSKIFTKMLALVLCMVMLLQTMPLAIFADEITPETTSDSTTETTAEDYGVNLAAEDPVTAAYTVEHYLQTADGYAIDEAATETKTGEVGAATAAEAKSYDGYTAKEFAQGTVAAEGTTVVAIYYDKVVPAATTAEYKVEHYLQTADGYTIDGAATEVKTGEIGAATAAEAKSYDGYTAKEFAQGTVASEGTTVVAIYYDKVVPAATTAEYKVEHYLQTEDGYAIDEAATETKTGEIGAATVAEAKSYEGYTANVFEQALIAEDGTTVVKICYSKNPEVADGNPEVDAMSDEELLEYIGALSDEELAAFEASLSEAQYQRISSLLGIAFYGADKYINTYESKLSTLAPGVTQTINQAYRSDGKYVKYFVAYADLSNPEVGLHATYGGAQGTVPGVSKMTAQIADMTKLHSNPEDEANYIEYYSIVAGVNGDGYNVGTGAPSGAHVMNGVPGFNVVKAGDTPWFAQFADGHIACGRNNTDWDAAVAEHGAVKEAIGGFQLLMKDGVVYEPGNDKTQGGSTYWRPGFDYPCSFVGVTNDGKLILMNCNGNNVGGSAGFDYNHTIEVAQELGVKDLLCLDGGGSATYLSRPEGKNEIEVTSTPSDGSERAVANGLVIYSTVAPSDVFKRATLKTEATHYTPCSEIKVTATGISPAGNPVEIPADVQWALADDTFGTITDGVFTSSGKTGVAILQMVYEGAVVGAVEVNIVNPTTVDFEQESMVVPFGKTSAVKMTANYYDEATGGNFPVVIKASDFTFSFSAENAGTMNGFELSAPEDSSTNNVTLYATYNHSKDMPVMDITVSYGKASEIIWDFEDGNVSNWLGWSAAKEWAKKNAPNSALGLEVAGKDNQINGQTPGDNDSYTFLATAENGQVRNGEYALGFTLDETHYEEYGEWEYNILFNVEGQTVLRDVANGKNATTVGMWIYMPEDLTGVRYTGDTGYFAMEGQWYCGKSADSVAGYRVRNFVFQDTGLTMAATLDANYTEVGKWVYMSADISAYDYVSVQNPTANNYREPCFIRFYFKDLEPNKYTFYFDDFTLDYSSAVEDRDAPVISDPKYVVVDNGVGFSTVCNSNKVLFTANVEDVVADNATGLDYSSAKIYVDGIALDNVTASGSSMTSEEITLTGGKHEVIFEIADNMGTITRNVEILNISGNQPIWVTGHNDSGALAEYDSVYYMDLKVADASGIEKVETEIRLNFANKWQLPYMTVAEGFDVEYKFVELTNSVKLTITKDADCALTGEQTLVSIPVRIWSWPDGLSKTAESMSKSGARPIVPVDFEVEYGQVTYADGSFSGYLGAFYDYFTTATKIQDDKYAWHLKHTEAALADKPATCSESGYTGRTYCDVCKSVVDWGTTQKATGHTYAITDGVLKCACGQTFTGTWTDGKDYVDGVTAADGWVGDSYYQGGVKLTGIQVIDGYYYDFGETGVCANQKKLTGLFYDKTVSAYRYAIMGELSSGWQEIDGNWHYFWKYNMQAATGETKLPANGVTYQFDETGMTKGAWHTTEAGTRYYYSDSFYRARQEGYQTFFEIDGKTYNFDGKGYVTYGQYRALQPAAFIMERNVFEFNEDGTLKGNYTTPGPIDCADGETYFIHEDGKAYMDAGLVEFEGDYYFVVYSGKLAKNQNRTITADNANGLMDPGTYYFGADGKMVVEKPFTGVKQDADGVYKYFVEGKVAKNLSCLVSYNGYHYYVKPSGKIAINEYRILTAGMIGEFDFEPGIYHFDSEGRLEIPFTGVKEKDGALYYFVDGKIAEGQPGLIEYEGNYYEVKYSGKVAVNENRNLTAEKIGSLDVVPGIYYFDNEGKMQVPFTGVKADETGTLYYYVNNKILKNKPGVVEYEGAYYDVKASGKVAVSENRNLTAEKIGSLDIVPGIYYFDSEGKMQMPFTGVKEHNGALYYFVDSKIAEGQPGLVEYEGNYYEVKYSGKVAVNEKRNLTAEKIGSLDVVPGIYYFDSEGKLQLPFTGVKADESGTLYYYVEGLIKTGVQSLIEVDGAIYYVKWSGKVAVNENRNITAANSNGLLAAGKYFFGADGKLVNN